MDQDKYEGNLYGEWENPSQNLDCQILIQGMISGMLTSCNFTEIVTFVVGQLPVYLSDTEKHSSPCLCFHSALRRKFYLALTLNAFCDI